MSMYVYFCKKLPNCLSKWLYHFAFLQAIKENSAFGVVNVPNFGHSNRYVGISLHIVLISWWHLPTFKCLGLEWHSLLLTYSPLARTRHSPGPDSRSEKHKGGPGCWGRTKVSATGLKPLGMAFLAPVPTLPLAMDPGLFWCASWTGKAVSLLWLRKNWDSEPRNLLGIKVRS